MPNTATRANGTTGTVTATALAYDAHGYKVTQSTLVSSGGMSPARVYTPGSTFVITTGTNTDGSIAFQNVQNTVVGGTTTRSTTNDDNGDGVTAKRIAFRRSVAANNNAKITSRAA